MRSQLLALGCAAVVAACGGGAGSPDDAPAGSDAGRIPDAATDAGVTLDAPADAPVDVPPAPTFTVEPAVGLTVTNHQLTRVAVAFANNLSDHVVDFTYEITGELSAPATVCAQVGRTEQCSITVDVASPTVGVKTGTLRVTSEGATVITEVSVIVDAFVGVQPLGDGGGRVTFDPAPPPLCFGGGCYAPGTVVTLTALPDNGSVFAGWGGPLCGTAATCQVTAGALPLVVPVLFAPAAGTTNLAIDITGFGLVSYAAGAAFGQCRASCSVIVPIGQAIVIDLSTPIDIVRIDGVATRISGGEERTYPQGTARVAIDFGGQPGELDLFADDVALDAAGDLALSRAGTVTVYDPAMAPKWSVAGTRVAFTPTGELYVQDGAAHTTKYDAGGHALTSAATKLGFVTPTGGMLTANLGDDHFTIRDAAMAVTATPTLTGPFGQLGGCLAADTTHLFASARHPDHDNELSFDRFTLDGTFVDTFQSNRDECHAQPDWHGSFVLSAWHPVEMAISHDGFGVDDLGGGLDLTPYDAAVDAADHLFWTHVVDFFASSPPMGGQIRKYTPPSETPDWIYSRETGDANAGHTGITPRKIVVARDGRIVWLVDWTDPFGASAGVAEIFPAGFTPVP